MTLTPVVAAPAASSREKRSLFFDATPLLDDPVALRSQHRDRIRLSCDIRFQAVDEEIHEASLKPHGEYTWEDLYQGWKNPEVQYYWQKHNFHLSAWDQGLHWQKERICT